ncbi:globin CTT-VI [Drosophila virilis]|uniref:Globin 1 n=1 Tax=Drosophila virilis TaxID=7244 RepID=Q3MQ63_DROVI|nr:globin CTT-VI [Drosophila virilis]XP_015027227.1 globin CTT-VI [Drosophila virilis]XP_032291097.1 globin CTT-VI [Drosophila virilis]EDW66741.1 globin 1, isoform A [Drosophila virilis]KRF82891.1 globin 1, isoform B [Drosophila virilis]CAJ30421.1 globin 1 [Drosophila virilis]CAJ30422.1 globin 1 [Drosophila virilis]
MNSDELEMIKKTWEIPVATPTDSGAAILTAFFNRFPSSLQKFPFHNVPLEELPSNARFRAHAGRIIRVFDESIRVLGQDGDQEKLDEIWTKVAVNHIPRRISRESYNQLKEVILEVLTAACSLNESQVETWTKLIDHVYNIIFKAINEDGDAI